MRVTGSFRGLANRKREIQPIPTIHGTKYARIAAKIARRDPLNRLSHLPGTILPFVVKSLRCCSDNMPYIPFSQMPLNRTEFYSHPGNRTADAIIGYLYLVTFVLGVSTNIICAKFFSRKTRRIDIPTVLYTITSVNDALICVLALNIGMNMLRDRVVWLEPFCGAQHILFQMSQRLSVLLVATLSITRTYILMYPLRPGPSVRGVLVMIAVFYICMILWCTLPLFLGVTVLVYHWESAYCWAEPPNHGTDHLWDTIDNIGDCVSLAFPVLPITVSCVISTFKICSSSRRRGQFDAGTRLSKRTTMRAGAKSSAKRNATLTIIIVTLLYIISNIPLFLNYVLYIVTIVKLEYPGPIYQPDFMYFYSWNVTAMLGTAANSTINPIVYITRITKFRTWLYALVTGGKMEADRTVSVYPEGHRSDSQLRFSNLSCNVDRIPSFRRGSCITPLEPDEIVMEVGGVEEEVGEENGTLCSTVSKRYVYNVKNECILHATLNQWYSTSFCLSFCLLSHPTLFSLSLSLSLFLSLSITFSLLSLTLSLSLFSQFCNMSSRLCVQPKVPTYHQAIQSYNSRERSI
eukprot:sb/3463402/